MIDCLVKGNMALPAAAGAFQRLNMIDREKEQSACAPVLRCQSRLLRDELLSASHWVGHLL